MSQDLRTNTATRITVGPFLDKTDGITPEVALTVTNEKLTFVCDVAGVPTLILDVAPTASGGANDMVHVTGDDAGYFDLELSAANVNYYGRAKLSLNDVAVHCPVFHEFNIISAEEYDRKHGVAGASLANLAGVFATGTGTSPGAASLTLASGHSWGTNALRGATVHVLGSTQGYPQANVVLSNTNANPSVLTFADNFAVTPSGTITYVVIGSPGGSVANPALVKLAPITHTSAVVPSVTQVDGVAAGVVTAMQAGLATPTNITAGIITTVTNLTNAPIAGDLTATMKTSVTTAATAATPNLNAAYDFAKGTVAMTESYAADGATMSPAQALYALFSMVGEFSVIGTTITCKKLDGTTTSMTFTLNDATNPTIRTKAS